MTQQLTLYNMDVLEALAKIENDSVDCIVTSPPYWALRDYGVEGQIGLEPTFQEYISNMLKVTTECQRVLKPTGTFWLNIGDTYASGGGKATEHSFTRGTDIDTGHPDNPAKAKLRAEMGKCMLQIPERLSMRMVDEQGWILRNDIIWDKPNHMPESIKDRLSKGFEHIYFLVKERKYYFNLDAIREPVTDSTVARMNRGVGENKNNTLDSPYNGQTMSIPRSHKKFYNGKATLLDNPESSGSPRARELRIGKSARGEAKDFRGAGIHRAFGQKYQDYLNSIGQGKNPGNVWRITCKPMKEAHFAPFPPELPERCIKAGCPDNGLVLDPFAGSGTTLMVARRLGMNVIGIDINDKYIKIIKKRAKWNEALNIEFKEYKKEVILNNL